MPLTGRQVELLATELAQQWDETTLTMFMSDHLSIDLRKEASGHNLRGRVQAAVSQLNGQRPPRDTELLTALYRHGNRALQKLASDLLTPSFFPADDPVQAVLLGDVPFVGRDPLRDLLRPLLHSAAAAPPVLLVRGEQPGGKSYTWEFLRHLAHESGATAQHLPLANTGYGPQQVLVSALNLLGIFDGTLPTMADQPQESHLQPLVSNFMGRLPDLQRWYWLVIDDLNHPTARQPARDFAYALAKAVEAHRPTNLHLTLLGYNDPIPDARLNRRTDHPQFPELGRLAQYLAVMASAAGGEPLPTERAERYAELLVQRRRPLTKERMQLLTADLELMGGKLRQGERL